MNSNATDGMLPLQRVVLETAAEHATRNIPTASPDETAAALRERLPGTHYLCASHIVLLEQGRFIGLVRMENLLAAAPAECVGSLVEPEPGVVRPGIDQEVAVSRAARCGDTALAVIDEDGSFIGLVPAERLLAILLAEHEEDLSRLGGFLRGTATVRTATEEPVARRFRHRIPWLLVGLAAALFSADIVGWFEAQLRDMVMLAFFIPTIVYLADAVGTQTETVVVRGLSVGIGIGHMLLRETATGLAIGLAIAVIATPVLWWRWGNVDLALGVGLALLAACSTATLVAMLLPWAMDRAGIDPAFGSGPLATVIQDLLSILIYFAIMTTLVI